MKFDVDNPLDRDVLEALGVYRAACLAMDGAIASMAHDRILDLNAELVDAARELARAVDLAVSHGRERADAA